MMSSLRRRIVGDSSSDPSRDSSPAKGEPTVAIPKRQLEKLKSGKRSKRRSWLLFSLGGLFGVIIAAFFAQRHEIVHLEGLVDFNLESLIDVIPAGIVKDAKEITVCLPVVYTRDEKGQAGAEADTDVPLYSKKSVRPSIMIPLPLVYTFFQRESTRSIRSS